MRLNEEHLVGIVAAATVPWSLWTIRRGLRDGRLPIGRSYVARDERPGVFTALLIFYAAAAVVLALVALDLLADFRVL